MTNLKHYKRLLHLPLFGLIIEQFLSAETKNENHFNSHLQPTLHPPSLCSPGRQYRLPKPIHAASRE